VEVEMKELLKSIILVVIVYSLMMTSVVIPVPAASMVLTSSPVSEAQPVNSEKMGPFVNPCTDIQTKVKVDRSQWGTRAYYDNKDVIFDSTSVCREINIAINTAPQIPGGITNNPNARKNYQLAADEEWGIVKAGNLVVTGTYGNNVYIGYTTTDEVVVKNKDINEINPGMEKAFARCGNWMRVIRFTITINCPKTNTDNNGPCIDNSPLEVDKDLSFADKPVTEGEYKGSLKSVVVKKNRCMIEINTIYKYPEPAPVKCIPGEAFTHIGTFGPYLKGTKDFPVSTIYGDTVDGDLKDNESFDVQKALSQLGAVYSKAWIDRGYGDTTTVRYLRVTRDRCPDENGMYKVTLEGFGVKDKGKPNWFMRNWKWFLLIPAALVTLIVIRGGVEPTKVPTGNSRPKVINR
jgi:hypothetical protein